MANLRIYRLRPPELSLTLVDGGTLAANTKYYVSGYFRLNWTYSDVPSIFAEVKDITTNDTQKSISVAWKVTVPIQSFEDGGTGYIKVNATSHCATDGNTIIIEDGAYAGTYTVTWVDYHSFLIAGTYSTTYTSTFRVESAHNGMSGLILYCSTVTPFSGDPTKGTWQRGLYCYDFSHYTWQGGITANPTVISAPYSVPMYGSHPQIMGTFYTLPPWCKSMEKGNVWISVLGPATVAELKQACIDADVTDIAYVDHNSFHLCGILYIAAPWNTPLPGSLTFTDMHISVYMGMMGGYAPTSTQLQFYRCSVEYMLVGYGTYNAAYAEKSTFMFQTAGAWGGPPYIYPIGVDNTFVAVTGIGSEGMGANFTVTNMTVNMNSQTWNIDMTDGTRLYKNIRINGGALYCYYVWCPSTARNIDGCYINSGLTYDVVDAVWYVNTTPLNLRNVDTPRADNKKIVYWNYDISSGQDVYFWRSGLISVTNASGTAITDASVNLTNNQGAQYNFTTDASGIVSYEILEQFSKQTNGVASFGTDTFYENWITTVNKTGFLEYKNITKIAKNIESEITLTETPDPVYYNQQIDGSIVSASLTGNIEINSIQGAVSQTTLSAQIILN